MFVTRFLRSQCLAISAMHLLQYIQIFRANTKPALTPRVVQVNMIKLNEAAQSS